MGENLKHRRREPDQGSRANSPKWGAKSDTVPLRPEEIRKSLRIVLFFTLHLWYSLHKGTGWSPFRKVLKSWCSGWFDGVPPKGPTHCVSYFSLRPFISSDVYKAAGHLQTFHRELQLEHQTSGKPYTYMCRLVVPKTGIPFVPPYWWGSLYSPEQSQWPFCSSAFWK